VRVLERQGCEVSCPAGQTCCGQPAFNAGCCDDARAMARHTIDVLSHSRDPVVVPSGSCADMIAHRYPELLEGDRRYAEAARELALRTYELSQFLTEVLRVERVAAQAPGRRLTYHASCHLLRGLRISDGPRRLLAGVHGAEVVALPGAEECCGFGGLFALQMSDISGAMLGRKIQHILETGAAAVVACDAGCLLQIEGGLRRHAANVRTLHLAEVLASGD
jgi:L-lactate dehydrogenase complex protein LldE